ncbi:MAG: amidohydrolase family protein [Devosia sp.]
MLAKYSRRSMLTNAAALAAGSVLPAYGKRVQDDVATRQRLCDASIRLIDTHVHLYDVERFSYPWLHEAPMLNSTHDIAMYRNASFPLAIDRYILQDVAIREDRSYDEALFAAELAKTDPRLEGMVAQAGFEKGAVVAAELDRLASVGLVKGTWRILNAGFAPPGISMSAAFSDGVRELTPHKWPFDLSCDASQLREVISLVDRCPRVTFVLVHLGFPPIASGSIDVWRQDISALSKRTNVVCKVSGGVTQNAPPGWTATQLSPAIDHAVTSFGFDRLIFGGNWPVVDLNGGLIKFVAALQEILRGVAPAEMQKLYRSNAIRTYGLRAD